LAQTASLKLLSKPFSKSLRLCLALSGGLDSIALLQLLVQWRARQPASRRVELRAIHIDHQLRPASAMWAKHCRAVAREVGVACSVVKVTVPKRRGQSLEAAARDVRYAALAARLRPNEWLVTAHHLDDQLETLLLQLMRGAGVAGLAGMPAVTCEPLRLWRPLLAISRVELSQWLQARGSRWIEDDSNLDERFDRNYLRHRVVPLLQARWPAASRTAARSAAHLGEALDLLHALAEVDAAQVIEAGVVSIAALQKLDAARQRNLLRHWIALQGLTMPDAVHLDRIRVELPAARADAQPIVRWDGGEVRRFRRCLYALVPLAAEREQPILHRWRWRREPVLELGAGLGRLRWVPDANGQIAATRLPAVLRVATRVGGERIRLRAQGPNHAVKELLRKQAVLPWERDRVPLVFVETTLAMVADLFIAVPFRANPADDLPVQRLRLVWERGSHQQE
jgi:tRNA(Ile)-lysidine synthase